MVPPTIRKRLVLAAVFAGIFIPVVACSGDSSSPEPTATGTPAEATPVVSPSPPAALSSSPANSEFSLTINRKLRYTWPASGPITTYFGDGHPTGIDIALDNTVESPIKAASDGTVVVATNEPSLGNRIEIEHIGGGRTVYGHLERIDVTEGQQVKQGDVIGLGGNTGFSFGKHLHFEVFQDGVEIDPLRFLPNDQLAVSGTERVSCAETVIRLDPASELDVRIIARSLSGYGIKTIAYTGTTAGSRNFGIEANENTPTSATVRVPAQAVATGETLQANLDIVMAKDVDEQIISCRLTMQARATLPNPPGTGTHDGEFVGPTPLPTATPTNTPVLGAQPVKTQGPQPPARATSTPIRNPTPQKPVIQKPPVQ